METIKIKDRSKPGDYVLINFSDYDPDRMEPFEDPQEVPGGTVAASNDLPQGVASPAAPRPRGRPRNKKA